MASRWQQVHGIADTPTERIALQAGPVSVVLEDGDLRSVRYGEVEMLRRVYVAVRDANWRTPRMAVTKLYVERTPDTFSVTYVGRFKQQSVDFLARVRIDGEADGTIRFALDGEAQAEFQRNRIGICVLHPIESCAGKPFQARKVDGSTEFGVFPLAISAHQPVLDLGTLSHEVLPGLTATVRFEGDTFEMEDQRNWTDASYKTYSTPLRLPVPVTLVPGDTVRQSVTLSLSATGYRPAPSPWPLALSLTVTDEAVATLPEIGLGLGPDDEALTTSERDRLRALGLAHLRVDLDPSDFACSSRLRHARGIADSLEVPLEVALHLEPGADGEFATLERLLRMLRPHVRRWLVYQRGADSVEDTAEGRALLERVRPLLAAIAPNAAVASGTNAYFTQLNRGRPPVDLLDGVCYSINPQVHAYDNSSVVETLAGQAWTVESARSFVGGLPLHISPVTLRPRFNANATVAEPPALPGERNSAVDPRQMSLLGAAWTAGSLASLGAAGVASVTYYEALGWCGVLERAAGSVDPERFPSEPGSAFPLYHVLADAGEVAGAEVLRVLVSDALTVTGLALRRGSQMRVIVANLTPEPHSVTALGVAGDWRLRRLDETTVQQATTQPEAFRAEKGTPLTAEGGHLQVRLPPYAVARLDRV